MKTTTYLTSLSAAAAILALPTTCAAQYRNSATGQTYNNSYSAMLSTTSTMMQNFNRQQQQYMSNTSKMASAYSQQGSTPAQPFTTQQAPGQFLYPITATDFEGAAWRETPSRLTQAMQGIPPQQKEALTQLYYQLLSDYEKTNRQRNVAAAIAYAVRVSLEINHGRKLSMAESDSMTLSLNNALASDPQFNAMTPQQKQIFYESSILTGGTAAVLFVEGQMQRNVMFQAQAREIAQSVLRQWAGM
jgi:hypothetical protein